VGRLEFELELPLISEARCRACTILGGTTPQNEEEVRLYTEAIEATGLMDYQVAVGTKLEVPPCVNPTDLAACEKKGRRCPRVEQDPENDDAMAVVRLNLMDHTHGLADAWMRMACAPLSLDEERAFLGRVATALRSGAVLSRLYPEP
jgi:hypothetical protein